MLRPCLVLFNAEQKKERNGTTCSAVGGMTASNEQNKVLGGQIRAHVNTTEQYYFQYSLNNH